MLALVRGDARVAAALRVAQARGDEIIVPALVAAQTLRGGPSDAAIYRLLHVVRVSFVGLRLARIAGALLGKTSTSDVAEALIIAEALRTRPTVVLTSDPQDMAVLAEGQRDITVVPI